MTTQELQTNQNLSSKELFSHTHDYTKFTAVANNFPSIQGIPVDSHPQFIRVLNIIEKDDNAIALFLKQADKTLDIVSVPNQMEVNKGSSLVYLGKPMDFEEVFNATKVDNDTTS